MVELGRIPEGLLGPGAVLKEDLIYTEVRIIDPEFIHGLFITADDCIL